MNVTKYLNDGSDNMDVLASQVDPLSYAENLTMSKLVVDATGDEFFQPQDDELFVPFFSFFPSVLLKLIVHFPPRHNNSPHPSSTLPLFSP